MMPASCGSFVALAGKWRRTVLLPPAWRPAAAYHSATLVLDRVYIIGQLRGGQPTTVAVYDCNWQSWSFLETSIKAAGQQQAGIGSHRAVRVGTQILVMPLDRERDSFSR